MRISSLWTHQTSVSAMLNKQAGLQQIQTQLTTGKKVNSAADNPIAATHIVDLNQKIQQSEQFQNNIAAARTRLTQEEGVLQSATDILHRINELGIAGLNDTNSANDRVSIASEMEELNKQLLSLANTKSPNGEYLFAGFKSANPPFNQETSNTGAYGYAGDSNTRSIGIGDNRHITDGDPGTKVFGTPTGPAPNTVPVPGSINNVFEAIDKFVTDLKANTPNSASLEDVSRSMENVLLVRSSVGIRLNALDRQEDIHTDSILEMKTVLSEIQDVDYAEAITRYTQESVALQAAQQTFSQLNKLSLFNYM